MIRIPCKHDGDVDAAGRCLQCGGTGQRKLTVDDLYKMIPAFTCKPGCTDCCGTGIPFSKEEWDRIDDKRLSSWTQRCPYRVEGVGCAIHEHRPLICRLYGCTPTLACPHGCKPSHSLPKWKADRIMRAYLQILQEEGEEPPSE